MSRLASFKGPSSPSRSPVRAQPTSSPTSPSRISETTHHRKVRTLLCELRAICQTWDDLVLVDGLKTAQSLVDARTELDNSLTLLPSKDLPPLGLVRLKIDLMEKKLVDLNLILLKLQKQFDRMATVVDSLESVLYDAHKTKGLRWVEEEPLWCTWTLERFAINIPALLSVYYRSLYELRELVLKLQSHSTSFETSRDVVTNWILQPWLQGGGWSDWEDLCNIEVEGWKSAS